MTFSCVGCGFHKGACQDFVRVVTKHPDMLAQVFVVEDLANPYDPNAIAWVWLPEFKGDQKEAQHAWTADDILGFIPKEGDQQLAMIKLLNRSPVPDLVVTSIVSAKYDDASNLKWMEFKLAGA